MTYLKLSINNPAWDVESGEFSQNRRRRGAMPLAEKGAHPGFSAIHIRAPQARLLAC